MKTLLTKRVRHKKVKPVVIQNYRASYLDHRSKTFHRIVMTAFSGLFGLVGVLYVFTSRASTDGTTVTAEKGPPLSVLLLVLLLLLMISLVVYLYSRRNSS